MCRNVQLRVGERVRAAGKTGKGGSNRGSQCCGIGELGSIEDENLALSAEVMGHCVGADDELT